MPTAFTVEKVTSRRLEDNIEKVCREVVDIQDALYPDRSIRAELIKGHYAIALAALRKAQREIKETEK